MFKLEVKMSNRKKVLIFPCGSEGALEIYDSLKYNLRIEIYGASGKKNFTDFIYQDKMFFYGDQRLYITHPDFETAFSALLSSFNIDFVIPTFDDVAVKLAEMSDRLPAQIITSPYETAVIAGDKQLMYQNLREFNFVPKVYSSIDEVKTYPVFVKPAIGCGSRGVQLANSESELKEILEKNSDRHLICEYLPGEEITVDCFTDRHGELRFVGPRLRERVCNGMTYRGRNIALTDEIQKIASCINQKMTFRGAWFFQAKRDASGTLKLLEFSVRQSTNSSLYSRLGINFSVLSLYDAMDMDITVLCNNFSLRQERRICAFYKIDIEFDTVYIDFDDTLTTHDKVNTSMMRLVYQFVNSGKHIILISRHMEGDLYECMKNFKIFPELFDEIIWIRDDTPKANYIRPDRSIFIDNYYNELLDVHQKHGIPVFNVDAADCLIDISRY